MPVPPATTSRFRNSRSDSRLARAVLTSPFARGPGTTARSRAGAPASGAVSGPTDTVAVIVGPLFATALKSADIAQPLLAVIAWLTVLLSGLLKFDFRGDLDHIDQLKSLPLPPSAIAVGQLVVPTLILSAAHILLLLCVGLTTNSRHELYFTAAALALPFNALLMSTENLIFLLFPSRPAASSPGDFQVLGRQAAQLVIKSLSVIVGGIIAMAIAVPLFILTGGSWLVLTLVAGAILLGQTCALVPAIAWAFARFDPSVDTPA